MKRLRTPRNFPHALFESEVEDQIYDTEAMREACGVGAIIYEPNGKTLRFVSDFGLSSFCYPVDNIDGSKAFVDAITQAADAELAYLADPKVDSPNKKEDVSASQSGSVLTVDQLLVYTRTFGLSANDMIELRKAGLI